MTRGTLYSAQWTLFDSLMIFAEAMSEKHPGEEQVLTEAAICRITGIGVAMRSALRRAGFESRPKGVWVRRADSVAGQEDFDPVAESDFQPESHFSS